MVFGTCPKRVSPLPKIYGEWVRPSMQAFGSAIPPNKYLRRANPRLLDLREAYACFGGPCAGASRWSRQYVEQDLPFHRFRGDCAFLWQLRENTDASYAATARYILAGPRSALLRKLKEDGLFGCHLGKIDDSLSVSRDQLDSVLELSFLDKALNLFNGSRKVVLDIGAGYGRLGHRITQALDNVTVLCTDAIPEATFICEYYLSFRGASARASTVPVHELAQTLATKTIDIAVNVHSFSECSATAICWWLDLIASRSIPYLFIVPNAGSHNGLELLSFDAMGQRTDFLGVIESYGYSRLLCAPKYNDSELQQFSGLSPTHYHLFKLERRIQHVSYSIATHPKVKTCYRARYRPAEVSWLEPSLGVVEESGKVVSISRMPLLHDLLARWNRFASLDEATMDAIATANLLKYSSDCRESSIEWRHQPFRDFLARIAASAQLHVFRNEPRFRLLRVALAELVAEDVLISDSSILDRCRFLEQSSVSGDTLSTPISRPAKDSSSCTSARGAVAGHMRAIHEDATQELGIPAMLDMRPPTPLGCNGLTAEHVPALLVDSGLPLSLARFAMFGDRRFSGTEGAQRNRHLLAGTGRCPVFMARHTLWLRPSSSPDSGMLVLTGDPNYYIPQGATRDGQTAGMLQSVPQLLAAHERVLGRSLCDTVSAYLKTGSVNMTAACDHLLSSVRRKTGTIGATITECLPLPINGVPRIPRRERTVVFHHSARFASSLGINARDVVPPFFPCGLNTSGLYLSLLSRCAPETYVAAVPCWGARASDRSDTVFPTTIGIVDLVEAALGATDPPTALDTRSRIRETGYCLRDLAALSTSDFEERLRFGLCARMSLELSRVEELFSSKHSSTTSDISGRLTKSLTDLANRCPPRLVEDSLQAGGGVSIEDVQEIICMFGDLLVNWPDIYDSFYKLDVGLA